LGRLFRFGILAVLASGCANESEPALASCTPPNRVANDRCLAPGVQDDGCPAGTLGLPDGSCQPAGVPPELCADGFEPDGDVGGEPVVPAEPCPPGLMAAPGESICHEVLPCGAGEWGDIPIDATTVYVDASYPGADSDGSAANPWITISQGVAAAAPGVLVAVAAGSYVEDVVVQGKPVRLHGKCPGEVEIVGTPAGLAALDVREGASGSEVRALVLTGAGLGLVVSGAEDVLVEAAWVHGALWRGVDIEDALGPTSVGLHGSLIEEDHEVGVFVAGSTATLEGVVVRRNLPRANDPRGGRGIVIQDESSLAPGVPTCPSPSTTPVATAAAAPSPPAFASPRAWGSRRRWSGARHDARRLPRPRQAPSLRSLRARTGPDAPSSHRDWTVAGRTSMRRTRRSR
jgi:hypothetical protein